MINDKTKSWFFKGDLLQKLIRLKSFASRWKYLMRFHSVLFQVSIPVSREGTSGTATVLWTITPTQLSGISSNDVTSLSGSLILLAGSSVANIEIEIVADSLSETDESMVLSLNEVQPSDTQRLRLNFTEVWITRV